ncbi:hypothetical protein JZ751_009448 [Albula glossodonta]|uniref:Uncharacterized protein n=1 Tax=Albula glossodonta TaxID=121402 RepID=A0A8T2P5R4_9TELE|nr:hypothetical protein JZ751_009448 [Albula glossodonta]
MYPPRLNHLPLVDRDMVYSEINDVPCAFKSPSSDCQQSCNPYHCPSAQRSLQLPADALRTLCSLHTPLHVLSVGCADHEFI